MIPYLRRGVAAGLIGGLAMALFLLAVGEQSISDAIALEEAASTGHESPPFSRPEQIAGGFLGVLVFGAAAGAVFSIVFAAVRHRLALAGDWWRAVGLAATAFVAVTLVPFLKYPANPPAVGDPDTIGRRTALYLVMLGWSLLAAWAAWRMRRWLAGREIDVPVRLPVAALVHVGLVALAYVVLPGNPDPVEAPATLVWRFRLASIGGSALFWAATGVTFGWLCVGGLRAALGQSRVGGPRRSRANRPTPPIR